MPAMPTMPAMLLAVPVGNTWVVFRWVQQAIRFNFQCKPQLIDQRVATNASVQFSEVKCKPQTIG